MATSGRYLPCTFAYAKQSLTPTARLSLGISDRTVSLPGIRRNSPVHRDPGVTLSPRRQRQLWAMGAMLALVLVLAAMTTQQAQAQTFSVIHNFTGGLEGATPMAGLTTDTAGNLYGTANYGGNTGGNCGSRGCGSVYRLANRNGSWVITPLYNFSGGNDGSNPEAANVVVGSAGSLYSTTYYGGNGCSDGGCGTVFNLQPPASACKTAICSWNETIIHNFSGGSDGAGPVGAVTFDTSGNLYGATSFGSFRNGGAIYQLDPSGGWTEDILYHPYGYPGSGVTLSNAGDLYGSTFDGGSRLGGNNQGSVYKLTPSGSQWIGVDIYDFTNGDDGGYPQAGVIFDGAGNLYGATTSGGTGHGGTVYEMSPSGDSWIFTTLYSFPNPNTGQFVVGPVGNLVIGNDGSLYGTTLVDGANGLGAVFKLTHSSGGWSYTSLHDFTGGSDGSYPYSNLVFDANGTIYGTASGGGAFGLGTVFAITP